MKSFEYLEHTADIKFRAYGQNIEEMMNNAALALFNAMTDTSVVQINKTWKVKLSAPDLEQLAYYWLSELVFLFETELTIYSKFNVKVHHNQEWILLAQIGGERIDPKKHAFDNEVKAVTLHEFVVNKNDVWCIQVVLDV
ncbi:MAG: archease [Methanotrichaceae archaeon]|nr:archease [Methanotrichaceae archaeon]MDD1757557.1 archease [Methanotrichaceae archaeon]